VAVDINYYPRRAIVWAGIAVVCCLSVCPSGTKMIYADHVS